MQHHDHHQRRRSLYRFQYDFGTLRGSHSASDYWGEVVNWRSVAKFFVADFIHPDKLLAFIRDAYFDVSAVVHMGAISSTILRDVDRLISDKIRLTSDIWDLCAEFQIPFFYASSAATYGALEAGLLDDQRPTDRYILQRVAEGMPTPPQLCGWKFFNVYGPNEYHKGDMQSVVAKFFADVRDLKPIRLLKSHRPGVLIGAQSRDFIYVKDCVSVMRWMLSNPSVSGLFNVGTGEARGFRDLIIPIASDLVVPTESNFTDMPEHLEACYQYFTQADISKLCSVGCTTSFWTIEDGVADYVHNHLATDNPCR